MKTIMCMGWVTLSMLYAQDEPFYREMETALNIHDTSSTLASEIMAANTFEKTADRYPLQWLPCFWASYIHSQIARLYLMEKKTEAATQSFKQTQYYFDRIKVGAKSVSAIEQSSMEALQSLIYSLQKNLQKDSATELNKKANDELIKAIQTNPNNPVVWVMIGTNLIAEGKQDKDSKKIVAGKILLESAEREFNSSVAHRSRTTNFNSEWLQFWIPEAHRLLQ